MADMRKKYKAAWFFRRLLVYALVLALLIGAALFVMNKWAESYQKKYEAKLEAEIPSPEPTFLEFIGNADADYWAELWLKDNPNALETVETVAEYMQGIFIDGDAEYYKAEDFSSDAPKYVVRSGDERLADITLALMADDTWSVREVNQYIQGNCSGSITLPEGCTVYCNGVELERSFATAAEEEFFPSEEYKDARVNPVGFETWNVSGLLYEPEFTYDPPSSDKLWVDDYGNVLVQLSVSDDSAYTERVTAFFNAFIEFFRCGCVNTNANAQTVQAQTLVNSAAYKDIADITHGVFLSRYYKEYTKTSSFGPIVKWADNFVSVDVNFSLYAESDGEILDNSGTYRVLLEQTDYGWLVVDYILAG